jgi:predicted Zn-dependent protease
MSETPKRPAGEPYDWYVRARELRAQNSHEAAAEVLQHLLDEEPDKAHVRELLAQAYFDARRWELALEQFLALAQQQPDDDYARYGAGMALWRLWRFTDAVDQLAMAAVMRPESRAYDVALRQVRATIAARKEAGYPLDGPLTVTPQQSSVAGLVLPEGGPDLTPREDA